MLVADIMLVKILKMHALDDAPWEWKSQWNKDMPKFFQVPNSQALAHAHGFARVSASEALAVSQPHSVLPPDRVLANAGNEERRDGQCL